MFLETEHGNFLMDPGAGRTLLDNARALKVDLDSIIQGIIPSHPHDHTGGLQELLEPGPPGR